MALIRVEHSISLASQVFFILLFINQFSLTLNLYSFLSFLFFLFLFFFQDFTFCLIRFGPAFQPAEILVNRGYIAFSYEIPFPSCFPPVALIRMAFFVPELDAAHIFYLNPAHSFLKNLDLDCFLKTEGLQEVK